MGVGEGVAFPAIHAIIARSVPADKQSTAVGIVTAASYGGTALAFGLAPTIIDELGWPVSCLLVFTIDRMLNQGWLPTDDAMPACGCSMAG
jgi:ACS family sodium-dependent inorganic phosphate cotransporter